MKNKVKYCVICLLLSIHSNVAIADVNWSADNSLVIFTSSSSMLNNRYKGTKGYSGYSFGNSSMAKYHSTHNSMHTLNNVCSHAMPSMTFCTNASTLFIHSASTTPVLASQGTNTPFSMRLVGPDDPTPDPYLDQIPIGEAPIVVIIMLIGLYVIRRKPHNYKSHN